MQRLMKWCAKGALGLGAAALLLAGVPAQAGPAYCESVLAPGDASRDSQPLRLAQSKTQQEEAEKLEQSRLKEQQEREQGRKMQSGKSLEQSDRMEKQAPATRAAPPKSGTSRFGAGVIRHSDPGELEKE
jgi:cobalamin-dependent methionine synthase I